MRDTGRVSDEQVESSGTGQDADVVRRAADAFGRALSHAEIDPYLELLDPDIDFQSASAVKGGLVRLRGHAEVRRYLEEMAQMYVELRLTTSELRDLGGGRFLVLGHWRGVSRAGGAFGAPLASILDLRDGKVVRMRGYMDEEQALEAVDAG